MLELRLGRVVAADGADLEVALAGAAPTRAWCDPALHPPAQPGDEVLVNVQARGLGLGSGGFDVVHANLSRGLDRAGTPGARVMKLNYTPLQHAVNPVDSEPGGRAPVAVLALHGQLDAFAWAFARAAPPRARLGYVQTAGGALPGGLSRTVARLRSGGGLAGTISAGPAYGAEEEAVSVAGALAAAAARFDAVVAGPGPGILGSETALGHGGMQALDTAHAALALGLPTLLVARMSDADPRERHRGLSHHTRTVLDLLLRPVVVALPAGHAPPAGSPHEWRTADVDLGAWPGEPRSMGREDPLFFAAALAAGTAFADMLHG